MDAVLVSCCPLIEESTRLDKLIETYFDGVPRSKWVVEMLSLKKKQYEKMYRNLSFRKILVQLNAAWGRGMI